MTDFPNASGAGRGDARQPLLAWKPDYALGIPAVDHEHRELFDLVNDLHASLFESDSEATVMDFLGELFSKISSHFALEEKLMRDGRYADFPAHKADHERLLDEIRDLICGRVLRTGASPAGRVDSPWTTRTRCRRLTRVAHKLHRTNHLILTRHNPSRLPPPMD